MPGVPKAKVDSISARAKEVLDKAALLPAHRREAHPSWMAATRLLMAMWHPASVGLLWHWLAIGLSPSVPRLLTMHRFSAGSLNGLVLHIVASRFYPTFRGVTVIGLWPLTLHTWPRLAVARLAGTHFLPVSPTLDDVRCHRPASICTLSTAVGVAF